MKAEEMLANHISQYLKLQYRKVVFRFDTAGLNLNEVQQNKQKKLQKGRGYPDLRIDEMRKGYGGLFIELKTSRDEVFNKNGTMKAKEHIREQANMLALLNEKGYKAEFGFGFEHTKKLIDEYLK